MPNYTQKERMMAVSTPLGPDVLLLSDFTGTEAVSRLFQFELGLLAEFDTKIEFDKLLGQKVTVTFLLGNEKRYFNGIVSRLSQGPHVEGSSKGTTFVQYRAEIVPQFWLLTRRAQSRIFQQKSVPDILKEVLQGLDVAYEIQGTFHPRDYCVQYRETDFDFASRLMEEEGIFYFFKHSDGAHKMVLANTPQSHADVPGATTIEFDQLGGGVRETGRVYRWEKTQEIRPGKYSLWDHCFELPDKNLEANRTIVDSVAAGEVKHAFKVAGNDKLERYDYPGGYAQRFDGVDPGGGDRAGDLQKIFDDATRTVGIRMQEEAAVGLTIEGQSDCRQLASGHKFTLKKHFSADGTYMITRVEHAAHMGTTYAETERGETPFYGNSFVCIPAALPFRPARTTPKARVHGVQTAVVVGPSGEEIFTDKYSRVKVQFHWDRDGKKDANSSCWIRVATTYAGKKNGFIRIPRIGEEVIVDFLEGDPDQPIIVGCVYNFNNMPPYGLPDNKTQSGIKSRITPKGEIEQFNELRFEDKKGSEHIYFHGQKDFTRIVENNDALQVGYEQLDGNHKSDDGSQTIKIYKDRTELVEKGNEKVTIDAGTRTIIVEKTDEHEIRSGDRKVGVKKGSDFLNIDQGNQSVTIKTGNQTIKLNMGKSATEAMQSIELKVGQSSIKIDQTSIKLKAMQIVIEGTMTADMKATMVQVNGSAMAVLKGGLVKIN